MPSILKSFSLAHVSAGFVAVLVGYTSAIAIVFQAAVAGGATQAEISSWLWALGIGMGVGNIGLSLYYKNPIVIAWSTPGAALLVTSLPGVALPDAIGAFIFCSALITICGVLKLFDRIMQFVPQSLAAAMLAGVLLRFGMALFPAFEKEVLMVGAMISVYILGKWRGNKYTIPVTFLIGVVIALTTGKLEISGITLEMTQPIWVTPNFDISTLIGVGLPLFIVTMASQNLPGLAVLRGHGYQTPASPLVGWTGVLGLVLAPFGGFAFNLAAITAAICMGEDVDEKPEKRYLGAVWCGVFCLFAGVFGATVAGFFAAFPLALVSAIAGLALLSTIGNAMKAALEGADEREAAVLTFLITASGGSFLTIGAPFWGLIIGLVVYHLMKMKQI